MRAFALRLVGATWRDRVVAGLGAFAALTAMGAIFSMTNGTAMPLALVTSVGASAVLVFAVPSSPLVQPWPVVGGSVVSAAIGLGVGLGVARFAVPPWLAAGLAVGGAIVAMSLLRCLHPPGGALALLGIVGHSVPYPLALVALNAVALVGFGWLFHRFSGHAYPRRAPREAAARREDDLRPGDIDAALDELGEAFDIDRDDVARLLQAVERHAGLRRADRRAGSRAVK